MCTSFFTLLFVLITSQLSTEEGERRRWKQVRRKKEGKKRRREAMRRISKVLNERVLNKQIHKSQKRERFNKNV